MPVPEDQLPVTLPTKIEFKGRGPSPLTQDADWLRGNCGKSVECACAYVFDLQKSCGRILDSISRCMMYNKYYVLWFIDRYIHVSM